MAVCWFGRVRRVGERPGPWPLASPLGSMLPTGRPATPYGPVTRVVALPPDRAASLIAPSPLVQRRQQVLAVAVCPNGRLSRPRLAAD